MDQNEIRWSAPEFPYYEKSPLWQWGVMTVAVLVAVIALFQKNFLFAVFAVVGGLLVSFWGKREPETLEFMLSGKGLDIEKRKFYPFETLTGFALIEGDENATVHEFVIRTKSIVNPYLKLTIPREQRERIREFLASHLPEIEYEESLTHHIAKLLRF